MKIFYPHLKEKIVFVILFVLLLSCNNRQQETSETLGENTYKATPDTITNIPQEKVDLFRLQPRIKKIDIIDGDTLMLTEYYNYIPYRNTFKYSNGKFEKFLIDSCEVVDFNKYGEIAFFIKQESDNLYEVVSNTKSITLKLESSARFVEISYIPAVISKNKIYILNFINEEFQCFQIPEMSKKRGSILNDMDEDLNFFDSKFSYTVFFENHLYLQLFQNFNHSALFDFNLQEDSCIEYRINSLHTAILNDDTLIFLRGNMFFWIRAGMVKIYKDVENKLVIQETDGNSYIFKGVNQVFEDEYLTFDKHTGNILYVTNYGLCLTKNDEVISMKVFDFSLKVNGISYQYLPDCLYITGNKLFIGSTHAGLYIFDYPSLNFEKRVVFTYKNLFSINRLYN